MDLRDVKYPNVLGTSEACDEVEPFVRIEGWKVCRGECRNIAVRLLADRTGLTRELSTTPHGIHSGRPMTAARCWWT